jgi:hypothetical protein
MLQYGDAHNIALDVINKLNLPDELDPATADMIDKQYLRDESAIAAMVDAELANYDTSDNLPNDVEDVRENAIDDVFFMLDQLVWDYNAETELNNTNIINNAYTDIVDLIRTSGIENVVDVDTDFEPSDSSVGIYRDERTVTITLSNGAVIRFNVEFDM